MMGWIKDLDDFKEKKTEPIGFENPGQVSWVILSGCCILSIGYNIVIKIGDREFRTKLLGYCSQHGTVTMEGGFLEPGNDTLFKGKAIIRVEDLKRIMFPGWAVIAQKGVEN